MGLRASQAARAATQMLKAICQIRCRAIRSAVQSAFALLILPGATLFMATFYHPVSVKYYVNTLNILT
jgi:hypothetical protein